MQKLYELANELENFDYQFDEETGELLNAEELDQLEMDFKKKVENVCLFIKNLRAERDAVENEMKMFQDRKKKLDNKISWFEGYVQRNLKGEPLSTEKVVVSYGTSKRVVIEMDAKIPTEYMRIKEEPDKNAIKNAIISGKEIKGCSIQEFTNMKIK